MAEVQSFTLDLENKGLMISRPGDVLPPGFLTNYLNMTANKTGFIESRRGTSLVSSTNLGAAVHSQGRIIVAGAAYVYQGASTSLYRAFSSIATGFSGNPLVMREGGPDLAITPHEIVFDSYQRMKDNGAVTTNFGIAGPMAAASATAAAVTTKTIDLFEYATNGAIQAAWVSTNATVTTTTTNPAQGTYAGNLAVVASTTGYIIRTVAIDLSFFSVAGDSTDQDYIAIYLRADSPSYIDEIRIMADVDAATNDFAHNFYWKAITPNLGTLPGQGTQTAQQGVTVVTQDPSLYVSPLDTPDPLLDTLPPEQLATGVSQWLQIFVKKAEFTRVGTSANNWANVAALKIQVKTNSGGTVNMGIDDFKMQSGDNLDADDYNWIYRYKSEVTGTTSPFSPVPFTDTTITKTKATVTVRNPRDTQATHIELYRRGGDSSIFAFSMDQAVAAWTGTTTLTDDTADSVLGDAADLTQVELANLLQTPSAISTSVRKTINSGGAYTDYTAAVGDDNSATYADLSALDTVANGDWLVIGADGPFRQILVAMDASVNTNVSTLTVSFWNGTAWRSVLNKTDGTKSGSITLAQGGTIKFDFPDGWEASTIDSVKAYYVRLSVSAALSAAVHVTEVRLGANAFDPTVCETHGGRIWCDDSQHTDRLWYSDRFAIEVFREDSYLVATNGGDPLSRPFGLDDQLFAFTKKTVARVVGSAPESFQPIGTGSEQGLFSKYAICKGNGRVFYRSYEGIYGLPASGFPDKISSAIDPIFHGFTSPDGSLLAIDNSYASTETMEFFDTTLFFGYTDTAGTRLELMYDLETERWEPADRKATSYLRLDDVDQFYEGNTDGYVYLRESGNADNGSAIAIRFGTQYLDFGTQSQQKQFTEILIDADLAGKTLSFYADFDNGTGVTQSASVTNSARGPIHFPLTDDTKGRNLRFLLNSTNGSALVKFYKVTFFFIVLPTPLRKLPTDWEDLGYAGDKRLRQLQLEIDTGGVNVSVAVQVDGATTETLTVNTASRQVVPLSLAANTVGKLVRLIISGASAFSYYKHEFEFLKDPLQTTRYDTFELDFGYTRWKFIRRVWLAAETPATVTMEIVVDEVSRFTDTFELTSPSGTGWTKTELVLPPGLKGKVFRFIFTSATGFKIFLPQSDVEWHPLANQRGYERARLAEATA